MGSICRAILLVGLAGVLAGCTPPTITNLTPAQLPRNSDGLYPFEVAWRSRQRSIRDETMRVNVVIGDKDYPMRPVPLVNDRWETLVPVPPTQGIVHYRYKFDYEFSTIPRSRPNSALSSPHNLQIIDR